MSEGDQGNRLSLPIASVMALASLAMGLFLYQSSLKSERPSNIQIGVSAMVGEQVLARLWEDPFEAVTRHREIESSKSDHAPHEHSLEKLQQQISIHGKPITVIAVIVESDPYAEGKEQRLRKRYAVLSALGESGYVPMDGDHIDYFGSGNQTSVPYEWYESSSPKISNTDLSTASVLVLWLSDDWTYRLPNAPSCRVSSDGHGGFLHDMATLMCHLRSTREKSLRLRIVGPAGSGIVRQWVNEVVGLVDNAYSLTTEYVKKSLAGAEIFSYSATADPAVLYSPPGFPATLDTKDETEKFKKLGISFERTISTDRELAEALIVELQQRGVDIPDEKISENHQDHIALIAEWDTLYGRALPRTFIAAAEARSKASDVDSDKWIHSYVYLRGLDGQISGKVTTGSGSSDDDSKKPANDKQQNRLDTAYLERPEGQSQFDYIRRLTMSIERDNDRLKREGKRFRAIGVLGSDVYDKLLILQALRKTFSNVIFFSTDLDARLAHPDEFDWSRNLIVASAYGLELNPHWQSETPPFRSSYQTALFLSTLKALGIAIPAPRKTEAVRLYEIGRRGAVELPQGSSLKVASDALGIAGWMPDEQSAGNPIQNIHPSPPPVLVNPSTLIGTFLASSILVCMIALTKLHYRIQPSAQRWYDWCILRYCVFFIPVSFLYVFTQIQLEPFSMFDGVSIWPTEIIRIMVILMNLYLLRHAKEVFAEGDRQIESRFHLALYKDRPNDTEEKTSTDILSLWQHYRRRAQWRNRLARVGWLMSVAFALAVIITNLFGAPWVPVRGTISLWSDRVILFMAVFTTNTLLFVVLDASLLGASIIHRCTEVIPVWPEVSLEACGEKFMRPGNDLQVRLTIQFIGMLSGVVGKLIYYPFISFGILIIARSRYFDNWDFPVSLLIIFMMNLAYALASVFILRSVAERARIRAIERVREQLSQVKGEKEHMDDAPERVQRTIDEIQKNREGAFASFLYQPAFGASLIPTSGITLLALLEYFIPGK